MKQLFFAFILFFLSSCTQKISNPELTDEIYKDLIVELDIVNKSLESEEKNLIVLNNELEAAVPQTGQIKFSRKKVYDAEGRIDVLKQQKQFFQIKIEQRMQYVRLRYDESLRKGGRPWPDKSEIDMYKAVVKFNRDKLEWERERGMKKLVPRGTGPDSTPKESEKK